MLIRYIITNFRRNKKINIILSIIFTSILMFFSQHLYLDSSYWINKAKTQDLFSIAVLYKGNPENLIVEPGYSNVSVLYMGEHKNKNIVKRAALALDRYYETFRFKITVNDITKIKLIPDSRTLYGQQAKFKSFKIDNKEYLTNNNMFKKIILTPTQPKAEYYIEIECKLNSIQNQDFYFKIKNIVAFCLLAIYYYFLSSWFLSKISAYNKNLIKNIKFIASKHKIELIIFIFSFIIYALFNIEACQQVNHLNRYLDNSYYMAGDAMYIIRFIDISQAKQFHPYFFLPLYPLYEFLIFVTRNLYLSLSLIWYTLASLSVVFLYKILNLIIPKLKIIKYLLVFIFMFSLTQLLMSYIFDLYIIVGFYLSILAYLVLKQIKTGNYNNLILTAIVSSLIFGVNMISIVTCLILIFPLFVISNKKIKTANYFRTITGFFIMLFILVAFFIAFNSLMNNNASYKSLATSKERIGRHIVKNPKLNLNYFHKETLLNPFVYSSSWNPAYLFYAVFILAMFYNFYLFKNNRVKKEDVVLYFSVLGAILYNYVCNFLWCPDMGFLFSQNFFILIFVLFSLSLKNMTVYLKTKNIHLCEKLNVIIALLLVVFLMFEIILNTKTVNKQHYNAIKYNPANKNIKINELN